MFIKGKKHTRVIKKYVLENGEKYTLTQLSLQHNVTRESLKYGIDKLNLTLEEAIKRSKNLFKSFRYKGKNYNMKQILELTKGKIKPNTIYVRVRRGLSVKEAIERSIEKKVIMITFNGKTQSIKDWANELNMRELTIRDRYKKGLSPEQIFSEQKYLRTKPSTRARTILYNGKMEFLRDALEMAKVSYSKFFRKRQTTNLSNQKCFDNLINKQNLENRVDNN